MQAPLPFEAPIGVQAAPILAPPVVQPPVMVEAAPQPVFLAPPEPVLPPPAPAPLPIAEPLEEVGYKTRPPLLEDVSVEGPLRIPVPHALDTLEQRDAIEEDWNWWRYSKCACPCLLLLLLLFITLLVLTGFQQVGDMSTGLRDGTPRYYMLDSLTQDGLEAVTADKDVRNLRIAAATLAIVGVFLSLLAWFARPRPNKRKLIIWFAVFLIFCALVCFAIAAIFGENEPRKAVRSNEFRFMDGYQESRHALESLNLSLTFLAIVACIMAMVALIATNISGDFKRLQTGWRQQERDLEFEKPRANKFNILPYRVRRTRTIMVLIALGFLAIIAIACLTVTLVRHWDQTTVHLRSRRGLTSEAFEFPATRAFEEEGWDADNTRLRYAWSGAGVLLVLLNFLPWRSRVVANLFFFAYFAVAIMALVSFGMDIHDLRKDHGPCPSVPYSNLTSGQTRLFSGQWAGNNAKVNCIDTPFVATAILEFIVVVLIAIYLLHEYIVKFKSRHSQREYSWSDIKKVNEETDSRRPVRCELTSQVMTAKEYYYRHRFLAGSGDVAEAPFFGVEPEVAAGFAAPAF